MSQEPPFGSLFGAPTGTPSSAPSPDPGGAPAAPAAPGAAVPPSAGARAPRAWYLRREVAVAGAAVGVAAVLGAVAFVVLGSGGGDALTAAAPATTPSASATASPGSPSPTVTRPPGGRNPFVDQGGSSGGNTTGTATASATTTTTAVPATTVTTTVAGPAVTSTKKVTTTKRVTTTKTRTVTAEPLFVYLRSLAGTTGEFTVNETEYDAVDEGDELGDTGIVYEDTPGPCIEVSYDGDTLPLCVDEALRLE